MAATARYCPFTRTAAIILLWCLTVITPSLAAPLNLSNVPIFLESSVEPNILFIADDSGSMDWEILTKDSTNFAIFTGSQIDGSNPPSAGPVKHRDQDDDGVDDCDFSDGTKDTGYLYVADFDENNYDNDEDDRRCNTADDEAWRMRTHTFNPMYFNPNTTYKPWPGVDAAGNPFQNMPITAAKANPYEPTSETIDLTRHNSGRNSSGNRATSDRDTDGTPDGFRYYTWNDADSDGQFDNGEETEHRIRDANATTKQNFANWFSYYRKRDYVAKAALGEVIAKTAKTRVGLVTLNYPNSINTPIRSMNVDPTTGDKRALLDKLYSIDASGSTYLRSTLLESGKYLSCLGNGLFGAGECPSLPEPDGGACQQNFVVLMTDGYDNAGDPNVGNTDGDGNTTFDGGAYADSWNNTLADVAMSFYENDIRPSLPNKVPITPGIDEATHQHMVTYTVAFGVDGQLTNNPSNATDAFSWPNPSLGNTQKIDDLRHAAFNGRGEFLSTRSPAELSAALNTAIRSIGAHQSSVAAVALNSTRLQADSRVYQTHFMSGYWTGQLLAFSLDSDGNVQTPPTWDAQAVLNDQDYDTDRVILTYNPTNTQGLPFRWTDLTPTQQGLLHLDPGGGSDGQGSDRLNYLRGSTAHEGSGHYYRVRKHRLGDLLHSGPYYVAAPPFPDDLGVGYKTFRTTYETRTPMLYVGGNDGMLHGFDTTTGQEKLAYVPNAVFTNLNHLTDPGYTHRYYVDGSPTVGDAYGTFGAAHCTSGTTCWRSVLVSGLRGGGQGIFALDVTDPSAFTEANADGIALWEFTDADDRDLGYTYSQPSIVQMANGKWAAVFGNGYNNTEADGQASTTGRAMLYIVFLDAGL
ncbi:MAG: PilC/PilY family type IV pilus protein, partial [Candidatus Tectomicrobia bacterium]|nr:PilC/PilY family type IV pilus protein [Candidatus Tectomicrobia bacterium]